MSDTFNTFKRDMIARGVAQVVGELYGSLHAIVSLCNEGLDDNEAELIKQELNRRSISLRDLGDIVTEFKISFVEGI